MNQATRTLASMRRDEVAGDLAKMEANGVPAHIADSLRDYVLDGFKPGSFTSMLIAGDIMAVCHAGQDLNLGHVQAIVKTFYNDFPPAAWGSPGKRDSWIAQGGIGGRA